jgi:hypothetical protein
LSPAAGSSSSSSDGRIAIARAISIRRWIPYGSDRGTASAKSVSPKRPSTSSADERRLRSYVDTVHGSARYRQIHDVRVRSAATRILSRTVRSSNSRRFWNVRATPFSDSRYGAAPVAGVPASRTRPAVGV